MDELNMAKVEEYFKEKGKYEPPVKLYECPPMIHDISEDFDNRIIAEISHEIQMHIDKEELIKALTYDREQYKKGFIDGYKAAIGHSDLTVASCEPADISDIYPETIFQSRLRGGYVTLPEAAPKKED